METVQCMKAFDLACLELKQGKGYIKNYHEIEDKGKNIAFSTKSNDFWSFFPCFIRFN